MNWEGYEIIEEKKWKFLENSVSDPEFGKE